MDGQNPQPHPQAADFEAAAAANEAPAHVPTPDEIAHKLAVLSTRLDTIGRTLAELTLHVSGVLHKVYGPSAPTVCGVTRD